MFAFGNYHATQETIDNLGEDIYQRHDRDPDVIINEFIPASYEMTHYYVQDVLSQSFPEFDILTDYDVDRNVIKVAIMDSGTKEIIKRFKFDHALARYDPHAIIDEVAQWCYDYLNPKPEEKSIAKISEKIIKRHKCECCGAPMPKGETKCAYCGSEYY